MTENKYIKICSMGFRTIVSDMQLFFTYNFDADVNLSLGDVDLCQR